MSPHRSSLPVDRLTIDDLTALAESAVGPVVSIHMPTARAGREVRQGPVRLANLIDAAEEQLGALGADSSLLAPLRSMVDDDDAWQHQADGLAIFADRQGCRSWRVALSLEESVRVAPHPHLRPVLSLANGDERFAILALSQHAVRLLDCTRDSVDLLELPEGTPTSMDEALAHEDPEKQLQVRAGSAGGDVGMFHGHGGEHDENEAVGRYLRLLDQGVSTVLRGTGLPLVVAAVERVGVIYREVSDHPDVLEQVVGGNPDRVRDDELRAAAWPLVADRSERRHRSLLAAIDDRRGSGGVIEGVADVALAAALGRVDSAVVDRSATTWGHLDPDAGTVEELDGPAEGAVELHDAAVAHALCTGASVTTSLGGELAAGAMASTRW
jgi:hypothetical protein